ncbi:MAG: ATP-binding protein [Methanomicrobiales archaeon]|nr:ATP-binding protein [Methanomicrobiales archaeon]
MTIESIHQQIVESISVGILVLDWNSLTILDLNKAACRILSHTPKDLIGTQVMILFSDPVEMENNFRTATKSPGNTFPAELLSPEGMRIQIQYSLAPILPGSALVMSLFPPGGNSTASNLCIRLLAFSPDPMFIMDEDFRFMHFFWERAHEYGINAEDLIGKTVHQYLSPASAEKEFMRYREAISTGQPLEYTSRVRIKGTTMVLFTRLIPLLDAGGKVHSILGVSRDITEQEKEKQEATQLEKEIDYRKDFVMTAAHELRTPLQPILGYLHLLVDDPEYFGLAAETEKMLRTCLDNVERERHIVDRMLELSLLYAEKISINPTDIILKPLVADIVRTGGYDRDAEIAIEIPDDTHLVSDRDCMYTVLECLISNAVRFNNPPKHVWIRYQGNGSNHQISVQDNGIGISPSAIHSIFEPFHLADAEKLSRQYNRIGLALSIARKYINLHGGTIGVESKLGVGSTFTVRIPTEVPYGA